MHKFFGFSIIIAKEKAPESKTHLPVVTIRMTQKSLQTLIN
jgi:hypothetical protein